MNEETVDFVEEEWGDVLRKCAEEPTTQPEKGTNNRGIDRRVCRDNARL